MHSNATNLALGRPATQSSTLLWSGRPDPAMDTVIATNGDLSNMFIHTDYEADPWWQVDLGQVVRVERVVIFNRTDLIERLRRFTLLRSIDGVDWAPFYSKSQGEPLAEYVVDLQSVVFARYVRVRLDGTDCLHFREVQVFATEVDPEMSERLAQDEALAAGERRAIPAGRKGRVAQLGNFHIFIDDDNYSAQIQETLTGGGYEGRERQLVREFVKPGDRVLEVGTAIGIVTMTAASIVGAANVATFDANPDIMDDAKRNFRRNGFQDINARAGVLVNHRSYQRGQTATFYIDRAYWASRLNASPADPGIVKTVQIPTFCLEHEIAAHRANVLICDIEGGEVELLQHAHLPDIGLIIMETHYWSAGEVATDRMIRSLVLEGFSIHLGVSGGQVVVLRRQ